MNKDDWRTAADTIEPYCKADGRLDGRKLIKALQRYAADFPHRMTPAVAGEYVKASDYDALAAENAALRAELAFARSTGDESALEYHALKARLAEAEHVCKEQAEDEGLWFVAETITESYLQSALRRLHAAVEGDQ